ncbi:MAG: arginine N-succinyltransferase, partial [Aquincola sp.]|nr:arginine N-succinyltransferase [Aquincola sp.]
ATQPKRFREQVVSELRGVVSPDGVSPFWEAIGRHFFRMDFAEADKLSAITDNQFILDLMPQHPIYIDLLPADARAVIGQCHKDGEGARSLLNWEGFTFSNVVDIFDGGPLVSAPRDHIRTKRESRLVRVRADDNIAPAKRALMAVPRMQDYRCAQARVAVDADVDPDTVDILARDRIALDPSHLHPAHVDVAADLQALQRLALEVDGVVAEIRAGPVRASHVIASTTANTSARSVAPTVV